MTTADALPGDMPGLRAAALALIAERDELLRRVERMRQLLRQFQRAQFGRHSERLDPDQLQLALEERDIASAHGQAAAEKQAPAPRPRSEPGKRKSLPAHLPRVEVVIEPETTSCPCCGGAMHVIGEEKSERLDVIPAQHRILVTRRPKYGCRSCAGAVVQAPAPERTIRSGLPTEALVAHVLVSKYAWHLPLYRQAQILLAQGIEIERSVLAFWVGYAAAELMPLWRRLRDILLGSPRLFVDETRAPVLDPGRGRTKTGYFWSIARDDSAWCGDTGPPAVVYTYAPGRGAEHATTLLAGYRGIVQCDGYAAYKQVARRGRAGNAERARQPIGIKKMALCVAVRLRAKLGGQIFRAPGQADQTRARASESAGEEHRCGGFGCDRQNLDMAVGQAARCLAHGKLGIGMNDGGAAFRFRQHDGVRFCRSDGVKVGIGKAGLQAVDAHHHVRPRCARSALLHGLFEKRRGTLSRACFAFERDRIFKIDDQRVGAAGHRLGELLRAVGGNEKQGSHLANLLARDDYFGRMRMKT